jgi:hypothetical protein
MTGKNSRRKHIAYIGVSVRAVKFCPRVRVNRVMFLALRTRNAGKLEAKMRPEPASRIRCNGPLAHPASPEPSIRSVSRRKDRCRLRCVC